MKNQMITFAIGILVTFSAIESSDAQIKLPEIEIYGIANKEAVSAKVTNSFSRIFKEAEAPKWYVINKRILVNFILNNQRNKAVFEKNGTLVYHLVYGNEEQMPTDVRKTVKSTYFDHDIKTTIKVNIDGRSIWFINIGDSKEYIVLKVEDGNMEVKDKYRNISG